MPSVAMIDSWDHARLAVPVITSLLKHSLQRHPSHPAPPGLRLEVQRLAACEPVRPLRLRFELLGDMTAVRVPPPLLGDASRRADGLWQHTCFEVFLAGPPGSAPYVEYNLAPSGAWAGYRFDGYRAGMRDEPVGLEPSIEVDRQPGALVVEVALAWPVPRPGVDPARRAGAPWPGRLGLTAVVEAVDGSLSYWALHHPGPRPDFHNDEGFALGIEVPA
jgi:hypothetical protein